MIIKSKILLLLVAAIFGVASCVPNNEPIDNEQETIIESETQEVVNEETVVEIDPSNQTEVINNDERYEYLLDNKLSGGPPPDGIPPIEEPDYITVEEASPDMESNEPVFVLEIEGETYIYPQRVLVWHEIVNITGEDIALTYCPLTGSAITYKYPENVETSFGTSGSLINSNLLMYDRHSDAFISQIDGIGLDKDLKGIELETLPTYWMEWQVARKSYPGALVLSTETGFIRNYNSDPYGSYVNDVSGNYYSESALIFPALTEDDDSIFHEKYSVIGVKAGNSRLAIDPEFVKANSVLKFNLNNEDYISFYDVSIENIRIYKNDDNLSIDFERGRITSESGNEYNLNGGSDTKIQLESPIYFEVMWFAWYGFYPDTEVINE